jgi:regulator of replication initiation timing
MPKSEESETIYDRIAKLEDEVAALRAELDEMKHALRNELARHEIKMIRKGNEISSIID